MNAKSKMTQKQYKNSLARRLGFSLDDYKSSPGLDRLLALIRVALDYRDVWIEEGMERSGDLNVALPDRDEVVSLLIKKLKSV